MHENFQFGATLVAILIGILFARNDQKELRADFRRMEDRLDGRIEKLGGEVKQLDGELKAMRKDYGEFYAKQRLHGEAIETLKKKS